MELELLNWSRDLDGKKGSLVSFEVRRSGAGVDGKADKVYFCRMHVIPDKCYSMILILGFT